MSSTTLLVTFAFVNVVVTGLFAGLVTQQFARRHRIYQLYWMIALLMAFVATLSYVLMVLVGPASQAGILYFRMYYILGGALTAGWLGLGSIALVAGVRTTRITFYVLLVLSALAAVLITIDPIDMHALSQIAGTPGTGILQPGAWLALLIILNSLGWLAVAGVAAYSGWKLVRRAKNATGTHSLNLLWANILILVGVTLVAFAGSLPRFFNVEGGFWLIMVAGWAVFYGGVVLASQRQAARAPVTSDAQKTMPTT